MAQPPIDSGWPVTQADSIASALSHSLSTPVTQGPNRLIVLAVSYSSASAIGPISVSGLGLTWTKITSQETSPTNNEGTTIWAAWAPSTLSAGTITITQNTTATSDLTATAWAYSNTPDGSQNIQACFGSKVSASQGGTSAISVTLTGVLSTSGAVCCLLDRGSHVTLTAQSNTTLATQNADTQGIGVSEANGHLNTSASGSVTIGSSTVNTNYVSGVEILYWNQPPVRVDEARVPLRAAAPQVAGFSVGPTMVIVPRSSFEGPARFPYPRFPYREDHLTAFAVAPLVGRFYGPERFLRTAWDPNRTNVTWGPYTNIVPPSPVPPVLPESFARRAWNPERSQVVWNPYTFIPPSEFAPMLPSFFMRPQWVPTRSFAHWPQVPPGPGIGFVLSANTVEINEVFTVFMTIQMPPHAFSVVLKQVFPFATPPNLMRFSPVQTASQSGFGSVVLPCEPIVMDPGESRLFIWQGVGFVPGIFTLGVSVVDSNDNYYPSTGTAPGPDFIGPPFLPLSGSTTITVKAP